jgi:exodeoxyribonuclease V gamma subunit
LLQHWLIDVGVRWGWDDQDKQRWDLPAQKQNTWVFGLQRLLAGYAMSGAGLYQGQDHVIATYADIEGQQAVALGKCYQFCALLIKTLEFCQQSHTIPHKVEGALALLTDLYDTDESEQNDLVILRETLDKMLAHSAQYTDCIVQDIFVSELQQNLQEKGVGQRFLAGYVNFCTLMPMRSIPFKMVCLLGMNDNDYPRQTIPMGFDLMRLAPAKRGDRSRRLDDRYLFLEALLSAREQLYFSYQGFSQKDNGPLSPSILLSELVEYCQQGFCLKGQGVLPVEQTEQNFLQHFTIRHKLQPFDHTYFLAEQNKQDNITNPYLSFNKKQQAVATHLTQPSIKQVFNQQPLSPMAEQPTYLELSDLIHFFHNPAKAFISQRWQTRFYSLAEENTDEEPFAFDGLDKYQLNERLIQQHLTAEQQTNDNQGLLAQIRAEGKLPINSSGDLAIRPLAKQSALLAEQVKQLSQWPQHCEASSCDIDLMIGTMPLIGRVEQLYGPNLILWRPGKLRAKDRINLYLQWLCVCATLPQSQLNQAHFISTEALYSLPIVEQGNALQQLQLWLTIWQKGEMQLVHFYPESAWQWVNTQDQNKTLISFIGNNFSKGEGTEPHIQRVCPDLLDHFETFTELADLLLQPLLALGEGQ